MYVYGVLVMEASITADNTSEERDGSPRRKKRIYCPHCSQTVGYSTYYRHRDRYYDCDSNQWITTASMVGKDMDCYSADIYAGDAHPLELQESTEST